MIETWAGMHRVLVEIFEQDVCYGITSITPEEAKELGERLILLSELASKGAVMKHG